MITNPATRRCETGRRAGTLMALLLGAVVGLACSDDGTTNPDGSTNTTNATNSRLDSGITCVRPPLSFCDPPGTIPLCPNNWYCQGCNCAGPQKAAACNPLTQDCRRFCTGCFPQEYESCADTRQTPGFLGRCGECFGDAGPGRCNVLGDAGPPDQGS